MTYTAKRAWIISSLATVASLALTVAWDLMPPGHLREWIAIHAVTIGCVGPGAWLVFAMVHT